LIAAFVEGSLAHAHAKARKTRDGSIQQELPGRLALRRRRRAMHTAAIISGVLVPSNLPMHTGLSSDPTVPLHRAAAAACAADGVPVAPDEDDALRGLPHQQQRHGASQCVLRQLQPGPRRLGSDMLLPRRQRRHPAAAAGAHDLQAHALRHRPMRRQSTNGSIGQTLRWYV